MKQLFEGAQLPVGERRIVNHSGRVTCCTRLYNDGFDEQTIKWRNGHRSSSAVELYKRASIEQEQSVRRALDAPFVCDKKPVTDSEHSKQIKAEDSGNILSSACANDCILLTVPDAINNVVICKNVKKKLKFPLIELFCTMKNRKLNCL